MDTLSNMHLFVEVASAGGFRAAAERLGMANSTLSRRIADLERDIGLRLFNRTTRRVELTEAGQLYFERCRQIVEDARLAHEELAGLALRPTGLIRASVPVDFTLLYLSEIVMEFLQIYPRIKLKLDVNPRQIDLIAEPVDLTIRIGEPQEPNLIARKLGVSELALYASPDFLASCGKVHAPSDLININCLKIDDGPWRLINRITGEETMVAAQGNVVANNIGLLRRLALQGTGITALPQEVVKNDVAADRLAPLLSDWRPPALPIYALTETKLLPAKIRVFIDFLTEKLRDRRPLQFDGQV